MLLIDEGNRMLTGQRYLSRRENFSGKGADNFTWHAFRNIAGQAQHDGAIGSVAAARQSQRAVEIDLNPADTRQIDRLRMEQPQELTSGSHRPHRMAARW